MKKLTCIICLVGVFFLQGCDDKKQPIEHNQSSVSTPLASKVEVVENQDFKTQKVATQKDDSNESQSFYYDYHKTKDKVEDTQKDQSYTPVEAALHVKSPYEHVEISLLVSKLSKSFIVKCSACHDDYANGIIGPSLLDKNSAYIYNAIEQFKTGKKTNVLMRDLVSQMSDKEIQTLADEIYHFNQEVKQMKERKK